MVVLLFLNHFGNSTMHSENFNLVIVTGVMKMICWSAFIPSISIFLFLNWIKTFSLTHQHFDYYIYLLQFKSMWVNTKVKRLPLNCSHLTTLFVTKYSMASEVCIWSEATSKWSCSLDTVLTLHQKLKSTFFYNTFQSESLILKRVK